MTKEKKKSKSKKSVKENKKQNTQQVTSQSTDENTPKEIDLSELSLQDLLALQSALPAIIEQARQSEKAILRQKMEALAAESGFELSEVLETKPKRRKSKQIGFVKAKYHNPENTEQTWTGRGRKPKWAENHLKEGGTLQELLINPEES